MLLRGEGGAEEEMSDSARSPRPEPPFYWQTKAARRRIREMTNGHGSTSCITISTSPPKSRTLLWKNQ